MTSVRQVRNRYLVLLALRWLAVGLVIPVQILLPLSRGLTLAQVGAVFALQGLVVLLLELPTGALTDSWGRRPVLVLATSVGLVASTLFYFADTQGEFALALALFGVFRALDSGPLEAWFVDATQAVAPGHPMERGLSAGGAVIGIAIAAGSVTGGGLVAWDPLVAVDTLALPLLVGLVVQAVLLPVTVVLMKEQVAVEHPGMRAVLRGVPRVVREGVALLRGSRVLVALVAVEFLWGFGMPAFESLTPVRLAEMLNDPDAAAAVMGPVGSAGWAVSSLGAALAVWLTRMIGVARSAALLRILQGATVVGMGLALGPVGLIVGFLACYLVHGPSNPLHSTLLHRQVGPAQRATVVSLNSMLGQPAGALGTLLLTALAQDASIQIAFLVAGVVLASAAPLYLPAWRVERKDAAGRRRVSGGGAD